MVGFAVLVCHLRLLNFPQALFEGIIYLSAMPQKDYNYTANAHGAKNSSIVSLEI